MLHFQDWLRCLDIQWLHPLQGCSSSVSPKLALIFDANDDHSLFVAMQGFRLLKLVNPDLFCKIRNEYELKRPFVRILGLASADRNLAHPLASYQMTALS
jgi:hypothetical protein